uniref:Uncharacterized protein n=1 Tax=Arundo donax TaxID=35708 RepID=A0A0A9BRW0_ARUDO
MLPLLPLPLCRSPPPHRRHRLPPPTRSTAADSPLHVPRWLHAVPVANSRRWCTISLQCPAIASPS